MTVEKVYIHLNCCLRCTNFDMNSFDFFPMNSLVSVFKLTKIYKQKRLSKIKSNFDYKNRRKYELNYLPKIEHKLIFYRQTEDNHNHKPKIKKQFFLIESSGKLFEIKFTLPP
jgi:hypothetical protein